MNCTYENTGKHCICGWFKENNFFLLLYLKQQSISFASLSPSMFENLELQLLAELSCLSGVVLWHGSSADESNVLR